MESQNDLQRSTGMAWGLSIGTGLGLAFGAALWVRRSMPWQSALDW